jgi:hypothetical protein
MSARRGCGANLKRASPAAACCLTIEVESGERANVWCERVEAVVKMGLSEKGQTVDALARAGDEGRGKLR